jgi:hypothetical protein
MIPHGRAGRWGRPIALLLPMLAAGCSSMHYAADWDHGTEFRKYETFEFAPTPKEDKTGPEVSNKVFLDRRIKRAVTETLEKKGIRPAEAGARGQLIVVYWMNLRDVVDVYTYGYYPSGATSSSYKEGTLVLDLVDRELDEVVWRGWVGGMKAEIRHSEEQIFHVVGKILRSFPPR